MCLVIFLVDLLCSKKLFQNLKEILPPGWLILNGFTFLYELELCLSVKYPSNRRVAC